MCLGLSWSPRKGLEFDLDNEVSVSISLIQEKRIVTKFFRY